VKIKTLTWISTMILCAALRVTGRLAAQDDAAQANIQKPTEFHGISPGWHSLAFAGYCPMRGSTSCLANPKDGNEGVSRNRTSTFLLGITKDALTAESPPASPWLCTEELAPAP
jgi:hypothetical protein